MLRKTPGLVFDYLLFAPQGDRGITSRLHAYCIVGIWVSGVGGLGAGQLSLLASIYVQTLMNGGQTYCMQTVAKFPAGGMSLKTSKLALPRSSLQVSNNNCQNFHF